MKHPHAELIAEWVKDTSRPVEWCYPGRTDWVYTHKPEWSSDTLYRFKPHKWQECIDAQNAGKPCQARDSEHAPWKDACWSFDSPTMQYRIKPETITYRVALMRDHANTAYTDTFHSDFVNVEASTRFIRWLGPVQEVEV